MFQIKSEKKNYGINFPTNLNEITKEHLDAITKNVNLPKHYCIIALAFNTKLFDFCTAMNNVKSTNVAVTPILAKIHEEDSKDINATVGQKIITDRTSLERGVHLNLKTVLNSSVVRNYFNDDIELTKSIIAKNKIGNNKSQNIIILEFKIVPVTDISASIDVDANVIDPYIFDNTDKSSSDC